MLTIALTFPFQQGQRSNFGMRPRGLKYSSRLRKRSRGCVRSNAVPVTHTLKHTQKHSFWVYSCPTSFCHRRTGDGGSDYIPAPRKSILPLVLGIDMWLTLAHEENSKCDAKKPYQTFVSRHLCLSMFLVTLRCDHYYINKPRPVCQPSFEG